MTSQTDDLRYRRLFENIPLCIFTADLRPSPTVLLEANHHAQVVYGYTAGELAGMPAQRLSPESAQPTVSEIIRQVREGRSVTTETTHQRRDDSTFPVRVTAALDPLDGDRMIFIVEDITVEKQRRGEQEALAKAIDDERRRIARQIHDGVAQSLGALRFKTALWQAQAQDASPQVRAAFEEMQVVLNQSIHDLRRMVYTLRPLDLEFNGLFPVLRQSIADFNEQNSAVALAVAQISLPETQAIIPAGYELTIFLIVQEGLANISQHARATSAQVALAAAANGWITLSIRDNGCGFDSSRLATTRLPGRSGLALMCERVQNLGGTLRIHSAAGEGTELVVSFPPGE